MLMMAAVDFPTSGDDWVTMLLIAVFAISSSIAAGLLLRPQIIKLAERDTSRNSLVVTSADEAQQFARSQIRRESDANDKTEMGTYAPFWLTAMRDEFNDVVKECQYMLDQLAMAVNDGDIEQALSCHTESARKSLSNKSLGNTLPLRQDLEMSIETTELIDETSLRATVSIRYGGNPVPREQFTFAHDEFDHRWKVDHVLRLQT